MREDLRLAFRKQAEACRSMEADGQSPGAVMKLTVWAGQSEAGVERTLGRVDFHGRWVEWA